MQAFGLGVNESYPHSYNLHEQVAVRYQVQQEIGTEASKEVLCLFGL